MAKPRSAAESDLCERGGVLSTVDVTACRFAGVEVQIVDRDRAVDVLSARARARDGVAVHLCNAYTLTLASKDTDYVAALQHRAYNLPDGVPVGWFGHWQTKLPNPGPVRGPTLMRQMLLEPGLRHFFLGGDDVVLPRLEAAARALNPEVHVVGSLAPPFAALDKDRLAAWGQQIRDSGADVVWVGLGTPKQDYAIAHLVDHVDAVLIGVGAAFDFLAGLKREAPERLRGTGFEWVHRLASEPRRLWRRYLIGNAQFLGFAVRELRAGKDRGA